MIYRLLLIFGLAFPTICHAEKALIGAPSSAVADVFIKDLASSAVLKSADVSVEINYFKNDEEILSAIRSQKLDIALVSLDTLKNANEKELRSNNSIFTLFTRPLLFESVDEIIKTQTSPVGDVVMAEVNKFGLVGLAFWNRGQSQLVANIPVNKLSDFSSLKIATVENFDKGKSSEVFTKFGASQITYDSSELIKATSAFSSGQVNAIIVEDLPSNISIKSKLYTIPLKPLVGVLIASETYWRALPERTKAAWRTASKFAQSSSTSEVLAKVNISRKFDAKEIKFGKELKIEAVGLTSADKIEISQQLNWVRDTLSDVKFNDLKKKRN